MSSLGNARPPVRRLATAGGLVVGITVVVLSFSGAALASPATGVTSGNISVGNFGPLDVDTHVDAHKVSIKTKGDSDVYVVSNVIAVGGQTGWHTHPGPSLITVKSGTVTVYSADDPTCTGQVYPAGSGFVDAGDGRAHVVRNEGSVTAEVIAVQFLPDGAPRRIEVDPPGSCAF